MAQVTRDQVTAARDLTIGRHPTPQQTGPQKVSRMDRILAVGSGKGGVGKSTMSSNLAVALARAGRGPMLMGALPPRFTEAGMT